MSLFKKIPRKFICVIYIKHRDLYLETLFTLLQCYRQEFSIGKNDLAAILCHSLENQILNVADDVEELVGRTLSERANAIIRRFLNTGWLESEPNA